MIIQMQDDLVLFATHSCSIFWSGDVEEDTALPGAVKGKLGGPSQRRLPISATTAVLQAVGTFCTFIIVGCLNSIQSWRFKKIIHCGCHHCSVEFLSKLVKCRYTVIQTNGLGFRHHFLNDISLFLSSFNSLLSSSVQSF
jgi:hypothetical protein